MRLRALLLLAIFAVVTAVAEAAPVKTPPQKPTGKTTNGPPFAVGGFSYELQAQQIHMFTCEDESCGPGSKVSYMLYKSPRKTFAQYKADRATIEKGLRARTPANVAVKITPPKQTKDKLFTTFESKIVYSAPGGRKHVMLSRTVQSSVGNIDLISSGSSEKQVELNSALFMIGALALLMEEPER